MLNIIIGSDHGGFKLKEQLLEYYKDELKDFKKLFMPNKNL